MCVLYFIPGLYFGSQLWLLITPAQDCGHEKGVLEGEICLRLRFKMFLWQSGGHTRKEEALSLPGRTVVLVCHTVQVCKISK